MVTAALLVQPQQKSIRFSDHCLQMFLLLVGICFQVHVIQLVCVQSIVRNTKSDV